MNNTPTTPEAVTVGYDGTPESRAAADWAARRALLAGAPLRLVHVWEWRPCTPAAGPGRERHWSEEVPRLAARDLGARHPGLDVTAERIAGSPPDVLTAVAGRCGLLVLGSRALGGLRGFLLGSVAQEVVVRVTVPVVLVRAGERPDTEPLPRPAGRPQEGDVTVGLDLARPGDAVCRFAFEEAALRGARLRAVHAWRLPPVFSYSPEMIDQGLRTDLEEREAESLTAALAPWRERHPEVEVAEYAVPGNAAQQLVEIASDTALLVVGRRLRRTPFGPRAGPVAHAAVHHAAPPVAVVAHP